MDATLQIVEVATPSRLHFGMFSFGRTDVRQFGGVGMMIDRPGLRLRISPENHLHARGPLADRVIAFVHRWAKNMGLSRPPHVHVDVVAAPPHHAGYGVGTQLGLAVAAGLNAHLGHSWTGAADLAALVDRGLRSSVGIYGFEHGGLIIERGKLPHERIAPLVARDEIPDDWRVVLVQPSAYAGLFGGEEQRAFDALRPVPNEVTELLQREAETVMLPALRRRDFEAFSHSVYRYGHAAGLCFAAIQGGPYNGPLLAEIVAAARRLGVAGVGQSSWGPAIFCLLRDEPAASEFVERIRRELPGIKAEYIIARPDNRGAQIN